jgi:hypothetical protein
MRDLLVVRAQVEKVNERVTGALFDGGAVYARAARRDKPLRPCVVHFF